MPSSTTTPSAIRDRAAALIAALTPTSLPNDEFREHRDESPFMEWCETKPASALRRYQVLDLGNDGPPETSDGVEEERRLTLQVTVAYPHTARFGEDQARDRYRVIREDQRKIEFAIGMHGKANFSPPYPDATWLMDGYGVDRIEGDACDFLVVTQSMLYVLDLG
jgi:hypothetical protein